VGSSDFKAVEDKFKILSYSYLPLILLILSEKKEIILNQLRRHINWDLKIPIEISSIRNALNAGENMSLIKRDPKTKAYSLTERGEKEVGWIKKLVEFLRGLS